MRPDRLLPKRIILGKGIEDIPARMARGRMRGRRTGRISDWRPLPLAWGALRHLSDKNRSSNYPEGPLNPTSTFPYRTGAARAEEIVNATRVRTVRFTKERMRRL